MVKRLFTYGVEYIVMTDGASEARNLLMQVLKRYTGKVDGKKGWLSLVDSFWMVNALRESPYRFYDQVVMDVPEIASDTEGASRVEIIRPLFECELVAVEHAIESTYPIVEFNNGEEKRVHEVIGECLKILEDANIPVKHHGWYKLRYMF